MQSKITDGEGNETKYTYDAYGFLVAVTVANESYLNENILTNEVSYVYNNDRIVAIKHNGFDYNISYDLWGQVTGVSVGTQPIISYTYGTGKYRERLLSSAYHNADGNDTVTEYIYDVNGNIVQIDINGETKFIYSYDSLGELNEISATGSRIIRYTDGRTDILDFDNNYIYSSYIDDDGNFIETVGGTVYTSKSYDSAYDPINGTTVQKSDVMATNGKAVGTVSEQGWFGRNSTNTVKTESANDTDTENSFASVRTEYVYPEYADNKTSNRIDEYINKVYFGTDAEGTDYTSYTGYSYTYDANGNITAEYSKNASGTKSLRYGYVYDNLNQLVRVNDAVAQKTFVYTYDESGNVLAKTEYPFTTGDLGTATNTVNYSYDDVWKDKLSAYGNTTLTYDDIGNSLTIGNKSFTWPGRQLETYTEGDKFLKREYY